MADFQTAYNNFIKPWEGGYAWLDGDTGGETYAGIARNYNPTWEGWPTIDAEKRRRGVSKLKQNESISVLQSKVESFYKNSLWTPNGIGRLKSQDIANIVFDLLVNSGAGRVLSLVGPLVKAKTMAAIIDAINASPQPVQLHDQIKAARKNFYDSLKDKYPQFYKGWINRLNSFPDLSLTAGISVVAVLVIGGILWYYYGSIR
jgi:lysozyme family protein